MQYQHIQNPHCAHGYLVRAYKTIFFSFGQPVTYRYEKDSAEKQITPSKECYHFRYLKVF